MWMQILTKSLVESGKWKVGTGLATYGLHGWEQLNNRYLKFSKIRLFLTNFLMKS